ncbi:enterochelin esterase [Vibrio atypicus]|uniref:enterochelin esterase n=1 Tax=Vibrio atypicus TaxID=558271 RepID=UPI001359E205|nr:enterochelin esterase [Vibrio atypicus]
MIVENIQTEEKPLSSNCLSWLERENCSIGDDKWWQTVESEGTPLIVHSQGDYAEVIFLWRSAWPLAGESIKEVYIDINGVTDHHRFDRAKLTNIEQTDVWFYRTNIKRTWRAGYSFMPVTAELVQPEYSGSHEEKKAQHRQWLRQVFPLSCRDELNQNNLSGCDWGETKSPLCMQDAQPQDEWQTFDQQTGESISQPDLTLKWSSDLLNTTRDIWLFCTASSVSQCSLPVVFVLDGRFWSQSMPIYDALSNATNGQRLPEALYVLIDEVNGQQRNDELGCNPKFWQALSDELIPLVSNYFSITQDPQQTAVVGQSLGGLSAMYAVLNWPERFGLAVSQSGSFWWPDFSIIKPPSEYIAPETTSLLSDMSQRVHSGLGSTSQLKIYMEVGSGEDIMVDLSQDLFQQLSTQQHQIKYRVFDGGHERLCWRGGIIDGLAYVFQCKSN